MLQRGDSIGVLGGGQLGRMLALAAKPMGLEIVVFSEEADCPAFAATPHHVVASIDDRAALEAFARGVRLVTYETENIPLEAAEAIAAITPVRPSPRALGIIQDRQFEKSFIAELGIATADFAGFDDEPALRAEAAAIGFPCVMKTRRLGYDGKGQMKVESERDIVAAWDRLGRTPCILEAWIEFAAEVSIVAARGEDGSFAAYDLVENVHRHHILATSTVPAAVAPAVAHQAEAAARRIADALDYVGVFAVEFFITKADGLLVNEIAPRVHNSGHWTIEGAATSQFEQHLRAIAGWPLGPTTRRYDKVVMTNLVGDEVREAERWANEPGVAVHLYGKSEIRPGRKMGHVTQVFGARRPGA
jgi:5-(carboxyamino)imidazole ribonucleotide synthase